MSKTRRTKVPLRNVLAWSLTLACAITVGLPTSASAASGASGASIKSMKAIKSIKAVRTSKSVSAGKQTKVKVNSRGMEIHPGSTVVGATPAIGTSLSSPERCESGLSKSWTQCPELDLRMQSVLDAWARTDPSGESYTVAVRMSGQTWSGSTAANGGLPPDTQQVYRVMSITKTFTAALVFRAVESGRLNLDGPLPPLSVLSRPIPAGLTVRLLLAHQSGFTDYAESPGYRADVELTPAAAVDLSLGAPMAGVGGVARYVNTNYLLLGLILEQVNGRPLADQIRELALSIGLTRTRLDPPGRPGWAGFSSGGVMSTVEDTAEWGDDLFTPGRIVSATSLQQMSTTGDVQNGLGLWGVCPCTTDTTGPERFTAIGHHTALGGMFWFPRLGVTLVMLAGKSGGDTKGRAVSMMSAIETAFAPVTASH